MYKGVPLKINKQTICSLHLLGHENKGDKNQQNQDGSEDELEVSPLHTGQQCTQVLRHSDCQLRKTKLTK